MSAELWQLTNGYQPDIAEAQRRQEIQEAIHEAFDELTRLDVVFEEYWRRKKELHWTLRQSVRVVQYEL